MTYEEIQQEQDRLKTRVKQLEVYIDGMEKMFSKSTISTQFDSVKVLDNDVNIKVDNTDLLRTRLMSDTGCENSKALQAIRKYAQVLGSIQDLGREAGFREIETYVDEKIKQNPDFYEKLKTYVK